MEKIDFGFKEVEIGEKQKLVQNVFSQVASRYDIMNDLMSFGLHRIWKNVLVDEFMVMPDSILLDVAGGTGDIAVRFLKRGGEKVTLLDLNQNMLDAGKRKIADKNPKLLSQIDWVCANAEHLPFADESFDFYSIAFGIRNITDKNKALREAFRVLKPGGKFACLELSPIGQPTFRRIYDFYSFKIIPKIGDKIASSADAYQYLVESIRKFPNAERFTQMLESCGFYKVKYRKLTYGVVAIHTGYRC